MSDYNTKINSLKNVRCPYCGISQKPHHIVRNWLYGKWIKVTRFECSCGNDFNFYKSIKSIWTIPSTKIKHKKTD